MPNSEILKALTQNQIHDGILREFLIKDLRKAAIREIIDHQALLKRQIDILERIKQGLESKGL
jgi:hypothetical protein